MNPLMKPPQPTSMSREEVIGLARGGRAWAYLALAPLLLEREPGDVEARFFVAASLARLGLKNLAEGELARLPRELAPVRELAGALAGLPEERMSQRRLEENQARAIAALKARARRSSADLAEAATAWREARQGASFHRALDGNVVVRLKAGDGVERWLHARDERARGSEWGATLRKPGFMDDVIVTGLCPPWGLMEAMAQTEGADGQGYLGHRPRVWVTQEDAVEALDGLAMEDVARLMGEARVELLLGRKHASAGEQLRGWMNERMELALPKWTVPAPSRTGLRVAGAAVDVARLIGEAHGAQVETLKATAAQVDAAYAGKGVEGIAARVAAAARGEKPGVQKVEGGLRVLIPTTRYTTYVQHAAEDLAAALARRGHMGIIVKEPDDHARLSMVAYQRAIAKHAPDMVVLINYTRTMLRMILPDHVPVVCWVQDAMPHLFDGEAGKEQGPLDFVIGNTFFELFDKFGFNIERAAAMSLVADPVKFHDGPVSAEMRERYACEVAAVTHHSETPLAMHERLCAEHGEAPAIRETMEALWAELQGIVARANEEPLQARIAQVVPRTLEKVLGVRPEGRTVTLVQRLYAGPIADRMLRHEALTWASEICGARGWRLHIYGKGWESHPTLAKWAKGPLPHGEALRAAYQCAGAHLHVSAGAVVHQRAIECALSGGLCLVRMSEDGMAGPRTTAQLAVIDRPHDVERDFGDGTGEEARGRKGLWRGWRVAEHAELRELAGLSERMGRALRDEHLWLPLARIESQRRLRRAMSLDQDANWVYGDVSMVAFESRQSLEEKLERAARDETWRRSTAQLVRGHVAAKVTNDVLLQRMLGLVDDGMRRALDGAGKS